MADGVTFVFYQLYLHAPNMTVAIMPERFHLVRIVAVKCGEIDCVHALSFINQAKRRNGVFDGFPAWGMRISCSFPQ